MSTNLRFLTPLFAGMIAVSVLMGVPWACKRTKKAEASQPSTPAIKTPYTPLVGKWRIGPTPTAKVRIYDIDENGFISWNLRLDEGSVLARHNKGTVQARVGAQLTALEDGSYMYSFQTDAAFGYGLHIIRLRPDGTLWLEYHQNEYVRQHYPDRGWRGLGERIN